MIALSTTTFAQEEVAPAPVAQPALVAEAKAPVAAVAVVDPHSIGVHLGANVGLLAIDVHQGRFYGFLAANAGVPLLTNGGMGAGVLGLGASFAISAPAESMWFFDAFKMIKQPFVGVGPGVGFPYLHRSGFVFGVKIPIFGAFGRVPLLTQQEGGWTTGEAGHSVCPAGGPALKRRSVSLRGHVRRIALNSPPIGLFGAIRQRRPILVQLPGLPSAINGAFPNARRSPHRGTPGGGDEL